MTTKDPQPPGKRAVFALLVLPLIVFSVIAGWILWAENHPGTERELRVAAQAQLEAWLPEVVSPEPGRIGFTPASREHADGAVDVILIHGLDEPGGIWDEMGAALADAGLVAWEFRYPNDQAIAKSADLLAAHWPRLASEKVYLVGHSMGGLVIRDFVSRHRHSASLGPVVAGPDVAGVVMIGTPNQGSEWVRLRAWLEIREWLADLPEGRASLFSALRDGTGAAKLDLRPDSGFLSDLNSRVWPDEVPVLILGGLLTEPTDDMMDGLQRIAEDLGLDDAELLVEDWWRDAGQGIGDGAVPVESLAFEGGPEPVLLPASHRGLVLSLPFSEQAPPAIKLTIEQIRSWQTAE